MPTEENKGPYAASFASLYNFDFGLKLIEEWNNK